MQQHTYVLFTNLSYVAIGTVRTMTNALVLASTPKDAFGGPRFQARGFGTEAAWPVFDLELPTIAYSMDGMENYGAVLGNDGESRPFISQSILRIAGGEDAPKLRLTIGNPRLPIDVEIFTFENANEITKVWDALARKVEHYWHAPAMPHLVWKAPRRT